MNKVLVTGSAGLIGSEAVEFFINKGYKVLGIDNDMRKYFFGDKASTAWNRDRLLKKHIYYRHENIDIRDKPALKKLFKEIKFDLIIHAAGQPSHDWAAKEPFTDFEVNAIGTLNMLEYCRRYCKDAVFIFMSTNKVYGDTPNKFDYSESKTRYEPKFDNKYADLGFDESLSIDQSKHSLFGVSKLAADVLVQEYGKYFNMKTASLRCGCLTGPAHSGTELHGFLAYLIKCIHDQKKYTVYGYKGKQVRDNLHSYDLVNACWHIFQNPRCGEVYNMGGSRYSNISMIEAISEIENRFSKKAIIEYSDINRIGDHMWYVSDVSKFQEHYPKWKYNYSIGRILDEMCGVYQ